MQFWQEVAAADDADDAAALATAALGLGGIWVDEHRTTLDHARVDALQRRALAELDADSALAGRLRIRLAAEQAYLTGDPSPILLELEWARLQRDPMVLADALSLAHHCLLGPHHAEARAALADELIAVSPSTGRPHDGLMGLAWRTVDLFLAGDRRATRSLTELRDGLTAQRCDALEYLVAALDVMLAIRAGRLDEAERLAETCHTMGVVVGDADALGWYGAQLVAIRWLQGRGEELLPLIGELVDSTTVESTSSPGFIAAQAALAGASGDQLAARAALACLRTDGLGAVHSTSVWSATMLGACEAAHVLGDADAAGEAYELLAPYADLPVMAGLGVACYGSAHRPLGLAAATVGDLDRAVDHLERAVVAELAVGGGPWHAMALAALADVLDQRAAAGDGAPATDGRRAADLRRAAIEEAQRMGMAGRAGEWMRRLPPSTDGIACRRDGRIWVVQRGERVATVPHSVGMEYLERLIDHADVEIAAVELASGHAVACDASKRDPLLDRRAKAAYRQRIEELRTEADDAEQCADIERACTARLELDRYLEELARATGFGGSTRSFADSAERARVSVHKAIKRALRDDHRGRPVPRPRPRRPCGDGDALRLPHDLRPIRTQTIQSPPVGVDYRHFDATRPVASASPRPPRRDVPLRDRLYGRQRRLRLHLGGRFHLRDWFRLGAPLDLGDRFRPAEYVGLGVADGHPCTRGIRAGPRPVRVGRDEQAALRPRPVGDLGDGPGQRGDAHRAQRRNPVRAGFGREDLQRGRRVAGVRS